MCKLLVNCLGSESFRFEWQELFVHVEEGNNRDIVELLAALEEGDFDNK